MRVDEVLTIGYAQKNMCYYTMEGTKGNSQWGMQVNIDQEG
jgi:hypothetical protein